eukprot:m.30497 g.30497  ORF g.30497 m.30497 type:complete len:70 (-) comp6801_c0_seq1:1404-1613(-)
MCIPWYFCIVEIDDTTQKVWDNGHSATLTQGGSVHSLAQILPASIELKAAGRGTFSFSPSPTRALAMFT